MLNTKTIGDKIAEARKRTLVSQAELAQRLFISPQAVGKWERGESMPDIITFNKLAEILGVDIPYFLNGSSSADGEPTPQPTNDSAEQAERLVDTLSPSPEWEVLVNFSGSDLPQSDFGGVTAQKGNFEGSALRGSNFAGADLTGSSFVGSDLREANFTGANLTDCNFTGVDLRNAQLDNAILVRTNFSASGLNGATIREVALVDVKLTTTDLRKTIFANCSFNGVDFRHSDLRGLCLDGQSFTGAKFEETVLNDVSFKGATLKNVSFHWAYTAKKRPMGFDGATMDKLTYAVLKGMGADLSTVTII
ncbi:MAG: helix-turn-helix domain-containing protein [Cytophagales bacterium]|nr:MAG: helix-turn-helix domain-containing protein [Cytophagales bacterium]